MSAEDAVRVDAYLVLAHAGIEEYLESYLLNLVDEAMTFATSQAVPTCFLHLAIRYATELANTSPVPVGVHACSAARGLYDNRAIKPNNGIRTSHLKAMCRPLGVDFSSSVEDAYPDTVRALETLAAKRGSRAHGTERYGAAEDIYPNPAVQMVEDVLSGLPPMLEEIRSQVLTISLPASPSSAPST
jgi:hypothetical protein